MAEQLSLISVRTVIKGKALSLNGYAGFFFKFKTYQSDFIQTDQV